MIVGLMATSISRMNELENRSMNTQRAIGSAVTNLQQFQAAVGAITDKYRGMGVSSEQVLGIITQMGQSMGSFSQVSTEAVGQISKLSLHGGASAQEFTTAYTSILQMSQGLAKSKDEANRLAMATLEFSSKLAMANGIPINTMMAQLSNVSDAVATIPDDPTTSILPAVESRIVANVVPLELGAEKLGSGETLIDADSVVNPDLSILPLTLP